MSSRWVLKLKNRQETGFTIVELLIVIVVIAILAAITIVAYNGIRDRAQSSAAQSTLATAIKKIEAYKYDASNGAEAYPADLNAAGLAGVSNLQYYYVSAVNYYCVEATGSTPTYFQTSLEKVAKEGRCPSTNGLIAWWPLNGDARNYVTGDSLATLFSVTPAVGQNGLDNGSYTFTGTGSYINTNSMTNRNVFSFSVWAYPTVLSGYQTPLSEARDCCGSGYRGFEMRTSYSTAGSASIGLWAGGTGSAATVSGATSTLNAWNFFSGTFDGSTLSLYKNGVLISSTAYAGSPGTAVNSLMIGRAGGNASGFFIGRIDDIRIYNRALSAAEITAMYAAGAQ